MPFKLRYGLGGQSGWPRHCFTGDRPLLQLRLGIQGMHECSGHSRYCFLERQVYNLNSGTGRFGSFGWTKHHFPGMQSAASALVVEPGSNNDWRGR